MKRSSNPIWENLDALINEREGVFADLIFFIKHYNKNEIIFHQNEVCNALHILSKGSVKTEMITENGNLVGIEIIHAPRPLAPAFLFSENNRFPVDVTTLSEVEVIKIPKNEVIRLMTINPEFMQQLITHNANRTQFLTNRLQLLSIKTIKGKIAHYLLENMYEYGKSFELDRNQTELAEFFGIPRPSFARSLSDMVHENAIKIDKKRVTIIDQDKLRTYLM